MASNKCPACSSQTVPKFLAGLSQGTHVHYWRCSHCHHVWTTSKDEVALVTAELGTWAGGIGAAVHGAEMADAAAQADAARAGS